MRILVTGGAGYIGSTLVPMLLELGHSVTVMDNFMYGQASLNHVCHHKRLDIVHADVRGYAGYYWQGYDVIIPLADIVGAPASELRRIESEQVRDANLRLIANADEHQLIVMPTTNSAYGTGRNVDETSPLKPLSRYARHKVEVEQALMCRRNSISLRLATVFGMSPRMRMDLLVNDFTWRAVRDHAVVLFEPHFVRNYVHVRDVARAFIHAIKNRDAMSGQIYNVGDSHANVSKAQLCTIIAKQLAGGFTWTVAEHWADPDQRDYVVSNAKIEATGWLPEVTLEEGIEELVKGYRMLSPLRYVNA